MQTETLKQINEVKGQTVSGADVASTVIEAGVIEGAVEVEIGDTDQDVVVVAEKVGGGVTVGVEVAAGKEEGVLGIEDTAEVAVEAGAEGQGVDQGVDQEVEVGTDGGHPGEGVGVRVGVEVRVKVETGRRKENTKIIPKITNERDQNEKHQRLSRVIPAVTLRVLTLKTHQMSRNLKCLMESLTSNLDKVSLVLRNQVFIPTLQTLLLGTMGCCPLQVMPQHQNHQHHQEV